jgi:uncharacterized protein YegP (UPF0339 family)
VETKMAVAAGSARRGKVYFYRDRRGEIRWRLVARNGRIVADSGEGYKRLTAAYRMAIRWLILDGVDVGELEPRAGRKP